jgi:hypothetical protein
MQRADLVFDILQEPITPTGNFSLTYRHVHLSYEGYPPPGLNGMSDLTWVIGCLRVQLKAKYFDIGEWSACTERGVSRFFIPPKEADITHVAIEIVGRESVLKTFRLSTIATFVIEGKTPYVRAVKDESHWRHIFEEYHRRKGGLVTQSGSPRTWTKEHMGDGWKAPDIPKLLHCPRGGTIKRYCDLQECLTCTARSFASHPKSIYAIGWNPRDFALNHGRKKQFECNVCGHLFEITLANITQGNEWCSFCIGHDRCADPEYKGCFDRSFASHPKSRYALGWNPRDFALGSNEKKWFECDACGHSFEVSPVNVNRGQWCNICSGRKRCDDPDCKSCFDRSFASHYRAKNALGWHPRDFALNSKEKKWFQCDDCDKPYEAQINSVASGSWCSCRTNKTEGIINAFLRKYTFSIEYNKPNTPRPNGASFRMDWILRTLRGIVVIELDGTQHFKEVTYWGGAEKFAVGRARDAYKMLYWLSRGARFIRLHQKDVFCERFDWRELLTKAIEGSDAVICLESRPRDSWADLRAEVNAWWGRSIDEWLAVNGHRLDAEEADGDEEAVDIQ